MTPRRPRPPRPPLRRPDVFDGAMTQEEMVAGYALAPFDEAARAMDAKWGVGRLHGLVSPETSAKYGSAMAKLNAAIDKGDVSEIATRVAVCCRGLAAMDAEAAATSDPLPPDVWEMDIDGETVCLIRNTEDWPIVEKMRPGIRIHTMREVAFALRSIVSGAHLDAVREHFPRAELAGHVRPQPVNAQDDVDEDLPF